MASQHIFCITAMTCIHRGDEIRKEICRTCGNRKAIATVYACDIHKECSSRPFAAGQTKQENPVHICLGCDDHMTERKTTIVYIYAHEFAKKPFKDELRFSLRSLANIRGGAIEPLIVGNPPEWYTGRKIVLPTILQQRGDPMMAKYRDTTAKFIAACKSPLVSDPFVTFMDDTVVWNPIDLAELFIPRYSSIGVRGKANSTWQGKVNRTLQLCQDFGFTEYDTALHYPYPFEKAKLLETIEKFQATEQSICLEVSYPNMHGQAVKRVGKEFLRLRASGIPPETCQVLNYANINPRIRSMLIERFPDISPWESSPPEYSIPRAAPQAVEMARDACVFLGQAQRFVRNRGGGRTPIFTCGNFGGECAVSRTDGMRSCLGCPAKVLRGSGLFVEIGG